MAQHLFTRDQLLPYFGLAGSYEPSPPTLEFRNVVFLGWGADFEARFLTDCGYSPRELPNLIALVNGQHIFKDVNSFERKCSLDHVVGCYMKNLSPLHLHNGGNDAFWETWTTLRVIEQGGEIVAGPPAYPCYGDPVLVCVDCEGWQGSPQHATSEIGISILDTRTVAEIPFKDWRKHFNTFHFRVEENMTRKAAGYALRANKVHPNEFHHGRTQIVKHEQCARLFDNFFRIPSSGDALQFVTAETQRLCAGSPASLALDSAPQLSTGSSAFRTLDSAPQLSAGSPACRTLDPCTLAERPVPTPHVAAGMGKKGRKKREKTPETESEEEVDTKFREEYFTMDSKVITPADYQEELKDSAIVRKRKRDEFEEETDQVNKRENEEIVFENDVAAIVKLKKTARNAQINALQQEFGDEIPQAFHRPAYKVVDSPPFPPGLRAYPQVIRGYDGRERIIPRNLDCPHYVSYWSRVKKDAKIACSGCDQKHDKTKTRCKRLSNGDKGCGAVLCKSCYNFLRPLHSKERQHASGISRKEDKRRRR